MFGSGGPESVYASQSAPSERMGSSGQNRSSHITVPFIDSEIVNA